MGELTILFDLSIIFATAIIVVIVFRKLGVPAIAGFIFSGFIVGPNTSGIIKDIHQVEILAEIGVVLLLFGIGLEISFDRLKKIWSPILIGGSIQVSLSILIASMVAYYFGHSVAGAIFIGFLFAVSSTAIVIRGMEERGEIDAPHGRLSLGILLFQDLGVAPMMLLIPILAGEGGAGAEIAVALLKSAAILSVVIISAFFLIPRVLNVIAKTGQRDLFVLTVFLVCVGTAWISTLAGVSLAIGGFLGGLVVAGSEYRDQTLSELIPFREVLTSIFFISIGMLIEPRGIAENFLGILAILAAIILGKFCIVFLTAVVMRLPLRVCILAGVALSQVGEFSFVMIRAAEGKGILSDEFTLHFMTASIISMAITPIALKIGPHIAAGAGRISSISNLFGVETAEDASSRSKELNDHTIIAGYGIAGKELARVLRENGMPYLVVDINPANVRAANSDKARAFYGDAASEEILKHLSIKRAKALVVVINDHDSALRTVRLARALAPELHILARTKYNIEIAEFEQAGADKVISSEILSAIEIVHTMLEKYGIKRHLIDDESNAIRTHCRD